LTNLLITENYPPLVGGTARFYWEVYRRLPREDYVIAAGQHAGQDEVDAAHNLRTFRVPLKLRGWGVLNMRDLWGYRLAVKRLSHIIKSEKIDMLHCARCLPEGVMAWWMHKWSGMPYLCYVWGEDVSCALASRELTWLTRQVLRSAAVIVTCSRNTQQLLVREWQVPALRIRLLHPGVDLRHFVPAERSAEARAALGWHDRPVLLTVGRLQQRKGHDQMILALRLIRQAVPDVLYAIVGDGEEREPLERLVESEGLGTHVQFLGSIGMEDPRLIQCYQQCDLFALPNRQVGRDIEGFGMVLVEAQACGKPVIGGMSGGTADTMRVPQTGRLIDCTGPDELAAVVSELLTDDARREQMGRDARQWTIDRFDWDKVARDAQQLFQFAPAVPGRAPAEAIA
jgi:phosphatidylinositol alpha-1,6-mannosyltransferase